jgi:transcriptional regulator with XRE-family HTH domain
MATFSERMRELRKEKRISLEKLAEMMGTTKATLSRYENSKRVPNIEFVEKLAKIFNVSVDYLLGHTDIRNPSDEITEAVEDDPDLRIIERARQKMSPKDRERMMKILKASFEDFFNEDEEEDENE